jgi:hypothetical protein
LGSAVLRRYCHLPSLIVDDAVINWIKNLYYTPDIVISILSGVSSRPYFIWAAGAKRLYPEKIFSNEAVPYFYRHTVVRPAA